MPSYEHICELLDRATKHFENIGDNTLWDSRWNTGTEVAEFASNCTNALKSNRLKQQDYEELWLIFAPTCTWDDSGGDVDLGNELFELLDRMPHRRALKSSPAITDHPPSSLRVNRVLSAGKIAPLLSWRAMQELPLFFRIVFLTIGLIVLGIVIVFAVLPLIAVIASLLTS